MSLEPGRTESLLESTQRSGFCESSVQLRAIPAPDSLGDMEAISQFWQ